jgi:hypothetical protein
MMMNYGLRVPLRERTKAELQQIKREVEISLKYIGSRQGTKEAERYLDQIEKELNRRK